MTCDSARHILHLDRPGERTPTEERDLADHLRGCAECRAELALLNETRTAYEALTLAPDTPDDHRTIIADIMDEIRSHSASDTGSMLDRLVGLWRSPAVRIGYAITLVGLLVRLAIELSPLAQQLSRPPSDVTPASAAPYIAYSVEAGAMRDLPPNVSSALRPFFPHDGHVEVRKSDLPRIQSFVAQQTLRALSFSDHDRTTLVTVYRTIQQSAAVTFRFGAEGG